MSQDKIDTALSEDEGEGDLSCLGEVSEGLSIKADGVSPTPGGPFSALTPSMWPQDILIKLGQQPDDPNSQPEYRYQSLSGQGYLLYSAFLKLWFSFQVSLHHNCL